MDFETAPLDKFNRISAPVALIVILILLLLPLFIFETMLDISIKDTWWFFLLPIPLMAAAFLIAYGFAPAGYEITETELIIRRKAFGKKRYLLTSFTGIEEAGTDFKPLLQRRSGSSGFFGYYGTFRNSKWGKYEAYCTNARESVVLLGKRPVVISPKSPEFFSDIVEAKIKQLARTG